QAKQGGVGLEDGEVAGHDQAAAAHLAEDVGEEVVIGGELVVQPAVFDGQAELFHEVEEELEFLVAEAQSGETTAEHGDAEQAFAVEDGDGDLAAEDFEFALRLRREEVGRIGLEDAAVGGHGGSDAGVKGEFEVAIKVGGDADRA